MAAAVFYLGHDGVVTVAASALNILRECTVSVERASVDGTTRGSANKVSKGGKKAFKLDLTVLHHPTDAGYASLKTALLNGTAVAISAYTADGDGPTGDWTILKMGRPEPMDGEVVVTFSAKPAGDITWTGGSGS